MLSDSLISIVMPVYNAEHYLRDTIQSVIEQTYEDWELLVVDDCSSDCSVSIIKSYNDNRIRLFQNEKNSGAAISRNWALRQAKGRWVAFLDADDIWFPTKLEEQLSFMRLNDYSFTNTDYWICQNGKWSPYICTSPDVITRQKMWNYCYISTITVMYDQSVVGLIQVADLRRNNDLPIWLHAVEKSNCHRYPKCLSCYIRHEGSISTGNKLVYIVKWQYLMYRKEFDIHPAKAALLSVKFLAYGIVKKFRYRRNPTEFELQHQIVSNYNTYPK